MTSLPHIVIVGAGAGGLELATTLGDKLGKRRRANITLIDRNRTHIWKPRLHEVATGALNATVDELSYVAHAHQHHLSFVLGTLAGIDRVQKTVQLAALNVDGEEILPARSLNYDTLVIAVGSQANDFNTEGAAKHCIYLDQRAAAERFHQAFLNIYLKASQLTEKEKLTFNIAIVGGGATGVELAAELNHSAHQLTRYGFRGIKPENVDITIIEAAPRVLPALSPKASAAIQRQLESLNINLLTEEMVTKVTADGLEMKSGRFIPAQLKVWSAGIKAPAFLTQLDGLETNHINQLLVKDTLVTTLDDNIFAFGDCASCPRPGAEQNVPPRAQAAHQQASVLAKSLIEKAAGRAPIPFVYKDRGSLVSLGRSGTIGNIMGNLSKDFTFEGKVARVFYKLLYRMHQQALHGAGKTLMIMLRDLINRRTGPSLKLH